jgi:hypothetical protein
VLDDFPLLQAEEIDDGVAVLAEQSGPVNMKNHVIAVSEDALDFATRVRTVGRDPDDVLAKTIEAIRGKGCVLGVGFSGIKPNRRVDIALEKSLPVEGDDNPFIVVQFLLSAGISALSSVNSLVGLETLRSRPRSRYIGQSDEGDCPTPSRHGQRALTSFGRWSSRRRNNVRMRRPARHP